MAGGIKGGRPEVSFHCSEKAQILVLVVTLLAVNFFFFYSIKKPVKLLLGFVGGKLWLYRPGDSKKLYFDIVLSERKHL